MTSSMQGQTSSTGVNGAPRHGEQLEGAATGLLNQAARTADAQASTTMTRVGQTLEGVAQAITDAGGSLRESQPEIAGFVDSAAEQVTGAAMYLRDHTASEALDQIQQVARRQPALVVGGGLVLGLVLGRLLRTGAAVAQSDMRRVGPYTGDGAGYAGGSYAGGGYRTSGYDAGAGAGGYGASMYGTTDATTGYVGTTSPADELAATDAAVDDADVLDAEEQAGRNETR